MYNIDTFKEYLLNKGRISLLPEEAQNNAGYSVLGVLNPDNNTTAHDYFFLPIPSQYNIGIKPKWSSEALGNLDTITDTATDVMSNGFNYNMGQKIDQMINGMSTGVGLGFAEDMLGKLGQFSYTGSGSKVQGSTLVNDILKKQYGVAVNPNMQKMFTGIDFTELQLKFTLIPLDKDDDIKIRKGLGSLYKNCNTMRQDDSNALTKTNVGGFKTFKYPNYFNFYIYSNVHQQDTSNVNTDSVVTLYSTEEMVMTNFSVTPNSHVHSNGFPLSYELNITLEDTVLRTTNSKEFKSDILIDDDGNAICDATVSSISNSSTTSNK